MGFLKIKKRIKRGWKPVSIFMLAMLAICGCGIKTTNCTGTVQPGKSQAAGNNIGVNKTNGIVKPEEMKTEIEDRNKSAETENTEDESKLYKNVPVYGKDEKKKIKKYLASLPDKITGQEAKKKGIIIQLYNNINENKISTMWQGFYKYAREGEEASNVRDGIIKCYAEPFKAAVVLLRYTTEGDACYTYISFIEGEYYVVDDNSRDKFRKCQGDGIYEIGIFKSLRKRKEITRDGKKNYCNIIYSVFKKADISKKMIKKITKETNSYVNEYYDLYSYYT